jgi:4-hydroxybutyrate CoA-transferase
MSWIDHYRNKLMTAREAVACVESGMRVYIHPGCAEPEALVEALIQRSPHVHDVEVMHLKWPPAFAIMRCSWAAMCARR